MFHNGKSRSFFTKAITPESLLRIYKALGVELKGKVGVKISTGEPGGHNYLHPELIGALVHSLDGTIVECCTAYEGRRMDPKEHWKAIEDHGFKAMAPCDIMDEFGEMEIPVENGFHLDKDIVGEHLANYDSLLILSHFKGHAMGGFGGALKTSVSVSPPPMERPTSTPRVLPPKHLSCSITFLPKTISWNLWLTPAKGLSAIKGRKTCYTSMWPTG